MSAFVLDLDAVREILMEADALRLDRQGDNLAPILGDNEVTRFWPEIQPDIANQCVAYLEAYASAKNNSKLRYVDNPLVSGEIKPGRWRQARVYVEMIGDVARVVQVLRRGWRISLLTGDPAVIDFSESRVIRARELEGNSEEVADVANTTSDNEEKYLMVRFVNLSNAHVKAVMTELRSITTVANLTINGENYGSGYRKLFATCNIDETDGSMTVDVLFAESQFTLNSYNQWGTLTGLFGGEVSYLWGVPKELAQTIITAYRDLGAGRGATCSYSVEQGTVDMVLNAKRRDSEGNLVKVPFETGIKTLQMCSRHVYTFYYFDVENPNDADYLIGTATETDPFPAMDGVVYRKTVRSNGDDTYDVEIDVDTEVERLAAISSIVISKDYFTQVTRTLDLGTDNDLASVNPSAGTAAQQQITVKDNCRKDVATDVEAPVQSREWSYEFVTDYGTTYVWIGRNVTALQYDAAETAAVLQEQNTNRVEKNYNRFGLIDYSIVKSVNYGSGDLWQNGDTSWTVQDDVGTWWRVNRKWCATISAADTFLNTVTGNTGAVTGPPAIPALSYEIRASGAGHTTTVSPASRGRCIATRVEEGTLV